MPVIGGAGMLRGGRGRAPISGFTAEVDELQSCKFSPVFVFSFFVICVHLHACLFREQSRSRTLKVAERDAMPHNSSV